MRLTKFTDYALRALIHAAGAGERRLTIEDTAAAYGISRSHLKKVVRILTREGFLKGVRGRSGGYALARPPGEINLGAVLRATEPDFALFECFQPGNACVISGPCRLPRVANEALAAFIAVFDRHTLADVLLDARHFAASAPDAPPTLRPRRGPRLPGPPPGRAVG